MGIRIDIEWKFVSPLLQRASGVLTIWKIDQDVTVPLPPKLILECNCHVDKGSIGYKSLDGKGVSSKLLDIYDNKIKAIMRAYHDGLVLKDKQFHWIEESLHGDEMFEQWKAMQIETNPYKGA